MIFAKLVVMMMFVVAAIMGLLNFMLLFISPYDAACFATATAAFSLATHLAACAYFDAESERECLVS